MPDHVFIDGPLAGQIINLRQGRDGRLGATVIVEVVDLDQTPEGVPRFVYLLESAPRADEPGRLRHADRTG
ncbi:hypothetical protein PU560_07500 [Georgenia sp. 10Sc9-8]|uniref:TRAM domain-containing protein n=1 Tax=Georgenia halotolerans TaxID=3028317 RepID=A0ABT5TW77_9MICO|nr:hypothetical protein [Georgenia halotolerans]